MSPTAPRSWFRSNYFITWAIGSVIALAGLPVTAIVTRHDPLKVCSPFLLLLRQPYKVKIVGLTSDLVVIIL